ncbi:BnaA01g23270D [Brassica napus]|uniref:BnaA01g23270D protein n=1 Tax=Brassica napus TaxID=3708 RepID=A0A078FYL6_BRANA|nr:BnaA01g23270D [Brassica napus]
MMRRVRRCKCILTKKVDVEEEGGEKLRSVKKGRKRRHLQLMTMMTWILLVMRLRKKRKLQRRRRVLRTPKSPKVLILYGLEKKKHRETEGYQYQSFLR